MSEHSWSGRTARALAPPNIALVKYWGKREGPGNFPAVPSLSMTLAGLDTTTTVTPRTGLSADVVTIDGERVGGRPAARVRALLDEIVGGAGRNFAEVRSDNRVPTASGLASSAAGFAALAVAGCAAYGVEASAQALSSLARRASASAARSLYGGFVELEAGPLCPVGDEVLAARAIAPADHLDVALIVAVTTETAKAVGSSEGMRLTAETSPFYRAWVDAAPVTFALAKGALLDRDLETLGRCMEASTLAMHASAAAAGVFYVRAATMAAFERVRLLRAEGAYAYATADAGPHLKVLVRRQDAMEIAATISQVPGVLRTITALAGPGARLEEGV